MRVPGFLPLIWQAFAARLPLCRLSLADWRLFLQYVVVCRRKPDKKKACW
jgi:hypothetical protein